MTKKNPHRGPSAEAGVPTVENVPGPEVVAKPRRRRFTAKYKLKILEQLDDVGPGERGAVLRWEGPYSSHVSEWLRCLAELTHLRSPRLTHPETASLPVAVSGGHAHETPRAGVDGEGQGLRLRV